MSPDIFDVHRHVLYLTAEIGRGCSDKTFCRLCRVVPLATCSGLVREVLGCVVNQPCSVLLVWITSRLGKGSAAAIVYGTSEPIVFISLTRDCCSWPFAASPACATATPTYATILVAVLFHRTVSE